MGGTVIAKLLLFNYLVSDQAFNFCFAYNVQASLICVCTLLLVSPNCWNNPWAELDGFWAAGFPPDSRWMMEIHSDADTPVRSCIS